MRTKILHEIKPVTVMIVTKGRQNNIPEKPTVTLYNITNLHERAPTDEE